MCRVEFKTDFYDYRRANPTSLIFDDVVVQIRCEVERMTDESSESDEVSSSVDDYHVVANHGGVSIVSVIFRATTLPNKQTWNLTRNFHFRNGSLHYVD